VCVSGRERRNGSQGLNESVKVIFASAIRSKEEQICQENEARERKGERKWEREG
jgi:hypothetical protein